MNSTKKSKIFPADGQVTSFESNGTMLQYSVIIAAVAILAALTIPFAAQQNGIMQAHNQYGIDTVVTGSIEKETKRYSIRKSILDAN